MIQISIQLTFRAIQPNSSVEECALRTTVALLRSTNKGYSEVMREKKTEECKVLLAKNLCARELSALIARRSDKTQEWNADDEQRYGDLCRRFDAMY